MANSFKRYTSTDITTSTVVGGYTVPVGTQTLVLGMTVANKTASSVRVSIQIVNGATSVYIVKNAPVDPGGSIILDVKTVMQLGDGMVVTADGNCDALMSILELT